MKKVALFSKASSREVPVVSFDNSNEITDLDSLGACSPRIDYMYLVPEDMKISYTCEGKIEYKDVHKHDIILQFYDLPEFEYDDSEETKKFKKIVVISSEDWSNNVEAYKYAINNNHKNGCRITGDCCTNSRS